MEKIIPKNMGEQFRSDYQRYGIYVTYKRIMSDIRDGLKPVQRRILYTMSDIGAINKTVKCATIVGSTMRFHGHGDASIYDTMKPMYNWFECYLPLLKGQGNFGSPWGDPPAAYRYTECRVSDFTAEYILDDLRGAPECVNWSDNYDGTLKEPDFLPTALPLLLINGSFGIGLGKKVEIPSHNTTEVIDAMLTLMDNPNANITLIPDTCMNCEIFDDANWEEISQNGFGYFTVRAAIDINNDYSNQSFKHRPALIIKSIPDMTYMNPIKAQIEGLMAKKKIIQIEDIFDESTYDNFRVAIVLKPGADPEYVRNVLYQNTDLQKTVRINFEMLDGLEPIRLSYHDYLLSFLEHRKMVKYRVFLNRLRQIETKMHQKDAFIKLLESGKIDEVIPKIRKYKDETPELVEYLIKLLKVTDLQAKYIIGANLGGLTENALNKLKDEHKKLSDMRDQYMTLVTDERALTEYIREELLQIRQKYGCPRRSKLIHKPGAKDAIPKGPMVVAITDKGFIKKVPAGTTLGTYKNDSIRQIVEVDNSDNLIIFDSSGKVYRMPIYKLPFSDKNSVGVDIRFIFKTFNGVVANAIPEELIVKFRSKSKVKDRYNIVTLTKQGYIKKMELDEFLNIPSSGLIYSKMDQGDYIQACYPVQNSSNILVFNDKKVMRLSMDAIPTMKRAARGNMTFRSKEADGMIPSMEANAQYLIVVTKSGRMNKLAISGIPGMNTFKREFNVIRLAKNDAIQNVIFANDGDTIEVRCFNMGIVDFPVAAIPMGSSITAGDKVLTLKSDQIIYSRLK